MLSQVGLNPLPKTVDSSIEVSSLGLVDLYILKGQFNYDVIFVMGSVL